MECPIIPIPSMVPTTAEGEWHVHRSVNICCNGDCLGIGELLATYLRDRLAIAARSRSSTDAAEPGVPTIALDCSAAKLPALEGMPLAHEGYELQVSPAGVTIRGIATAGVFYGVQSLLQLLPPYREPSAAAAIGVPSLTIVDAPRFLWRGVLLDCGRHFFPLPFIKKFLDVMALHKLNRFHWHLCEDQGWRIETDAYPQLTNVGAWRGGRKDLPKYGGFYSKADMREVVAYAAARCIEVVPEVELPGHCGAALASYPHLGCTGLVTETPYYWGVHEDVYCAGKESTFEFLETVLKEVIEIFPCTYLHVGGDECPKVRWADCPLCQQRIAEEGLADEFELQSWFVGRIGRFLAQHGRVLVGWDEILEGTADGRRLPPESVVMSWRGISGGIRAARAGHPVIMTPTSHCYLDYRQSLRAGEPGAWYALLPLEMVYDYDPVPPEAPPSPLPNAMVGPLPMSPNGDGAAGNSDAEMEDETPASGKATYNDTLLSSPSALSGGTDEVSEPPMMPVDVDLSLTAAESQLILGAQANLWTEYVPDEPTAEYMLLPSKIEPTFLCAKQFCRMCAMAEVLWSPPQRKGWEGFLARLPTVLRHFDVIGMRYRSLG